MWRKEEGEVCGEERRMRCGRREEGKVYGKGRRVRGEEQVMGWWWEGRRAVRGNLLSYVSQPCTAAM